MPQIDIRLQTTADTSGFAQTSAASANLGKSLGDLGGRMEHLFQGRHLVSALAVGLGLEIPKIADHIARFATGMSELEEKASKSVEALSDRATELVLKNGRARMSGEQQLAVAIADRDKLQRQIEASTATTAVQQEEVLKKRIQLEERIAEIRGLEAKNSPEAKIQAELAAVALRMQTVMADPNRTEFDKKPQEISLLGEELDLREKLIAAISSAKLENGETETTRDAKLEKLKADNINLRNRLNFLMFSTPGAEADHKTANGYDQFKAQPDIGSGGHLGRDIENSAVVGAKDWVVKTGTVANQVSTSIENTLGKVVSSITDGIMSWVEGAKTFGQAMAAIGGSILKAILGDIIEIGVKMAVNAVVGRAIALATAAENLGTAAAVAPAMAAIWAVPATLATIATLGGAAAQAPLSIMGAEGIVLGSSLMSAEVGGFTPGGPSNQVAGVVHAGEWVAPQWMVSHPGFGSIIAGLEGARSGMRGFDVGGFTSPGRNLTRPAYTKTENARPVVNVLMDPQVFARLMQERSTEYFEDLTVKHMRKNA